MQAELSALLSAELSPAGSEPNHPWKNTTSFCNILRGLFPNVKIDENGDDFIDFVLEGVTKNQFIKILESKFQVELKTFPGKG